MSNPEVIVIEVPAPVQSVQVQIPGLTGTPGVSIVDAEVDVDGDLLITLSDASVINAGMVKGADGRAVTGTSIDGSGNLIFTFSSGTSPVNLGDVTGVSVVGATVNGSYHLILTLSDSSTIDAGYVRGPAGTGDMTGPGAAVNNTPAVFDGTTGKLLKNITYAAFKALLSLVKGDVGLGNVDNTSDANKPISTATQTALNAKLTTTDLTAAPSGAVYDLFGLDSNGDLVRSPGVLNALDVIEEGGARNFRVENNINATNNFLVQGGIDGSGPVMVPEGAAADIDAFFAAKGDAAVQFGNGIGGIVVLDTGNVSPETDDGTALGTLDKKWSDAFFASGAVINFGAGNVTVTHTNNLLTLNKTLRLASVTTDGAAGADRYNSFTTAGSVRFVYGVSGAESGSNVGADFVILRYDDTGSYLGLPFGISRRNGNVRIPRLVVGAAAQYTAADIANKNVAPNNVEKELGLEIWDITNKRKLRASGGVNTDAWDVIDGSASVIPA